MVLWLRRDDLTLDAREAGSGLLVDASEMLSGASDDHPDRGLNCYLPPWPPKRAGWSRMRL